jgi:cell division protein FtsI/penicillin-binding protein 2
MKTRVQPRYIREQFISPEASIYLKRNILYTVSLLFIMVLIAYVFRLQVLTDPKSFGQSYNQELIRPEKGQIFIQNYALNSPKPLTISNYSTKIIINPTAFNKTLQLNKIDLDEACAVLASLLNFPVGQVKQKIQDNVTNNTSAYYILYPNVAPEISIKLKTILNTNFYRTSDYSKYNIGNWLSYEDNESRLYPQSNLAGPIVGYASESYWSTADIEKEKRCGDLVDKNRLFQSAGYKIGLSGLEAQFCSKMNGTNGLRGIKEPVSGDNIYLTLDYNLQKEAEKINDQIIKDNTNNKGGPKNVTSIIVEVNNPNTSKNGRIVAMASNPTFNPNEYSKEYENNPSAFLNYATDVPYEAGSVLKPLVVSALLNEYFIAKKDNPGANCATDKRLCVSPNWTFEDTCGGKRYSSENILIKNYNNNCFIGTLGLKEVLRDSINTGIAEMATNNIKTEVLRDYYLNKFNFGRLTSIQANNEAVGNVDSIKENNGYNINNAYFGFGQGFSNTPIQLIQSYIPLTTGGFQYPVKMVEDNQSVKPVQIIDPEAAKLVKGYMAATSYEGYRGTGSKLGLDGYGNGTKTGTAQIARYNQILGPDKKPLLDDQGKEKKEWCSYDCNSEKGLYEHTLIGFAPFNTPRFLVLIKVSEPRPYESSLTSSIQVLKKPWQELMQYTLEYMKIDKEY